MTSQATGVKVGCNESVPTAGLRFGYHRCNRPVVDGDKCKIHCQAAVSARQERSRARYEEKTRADDARKTLWYGRHYIDALKLVEVDLTAGDIPAKTRVALALDRVRAALKEVPRTEA